MVAFLAAMEIMSEQFPGAFSGYDLKVNSLHSWFFYHVLNDILQCLYVIRVATIWLDILRFPLSSVEHLYR